MQLTKQTDYAFRTLIYLARLPKGELASIATLCEFYDISSNHLSKIVVKLGHLGYIETVRGKGGGIRLQEGALQLPLSAIVEAFETSLMPVNCFNPPCQLLPDCLLKTVLRDAMQAFVAVLASYSLQDLVRRDVQVLQLIDKKSSEG